MAVKTTKPPKEQGYSVGVVLNNVFNSQEYNNDLKGTNRIKIFNEMRLSDASVKATLLAVKLPILSAKWRVDPAGELTQDKRIAEFVEDELFNHRTRSWRDTLQEILLYLDFGVMAFEKVYEFRGEYLGLHKIASRFPDTISDWKLDNGKDGIVQYSNHSSGIGDKIEIPMEKLVVFTNQKEGDNWEGYSLLRGAYKHYYIKDKYYRIDAMATERQGLGIPIARKPVGATPKDEAELTRILKSIRANDENGILLPDGFEVEFMDMKSSTTKDPEKMILHHDRQITKNVLAQFLELGTQGGSFALNRDQSSMFIMGLESVSQYICDTINKYLVRELVDLNFDVEEYPELTYDQIGEQDLNIWSTALQRVFQVGAVEPDDNINRHVRNIMGLPESDGKIIKEEDVDLFLEDILMELNKMTGNNQPLVASNGILVKTRMFVMKVRKHFLSLRVKGKAFDDAGVAKEFSKFIDEKEKLLIQIDKNNDKKPIDSEVSDLQAEVRKAIEHVKNNLK